MRRAVLGSRSSRARIAELARENGVDAELVKLKAKAESGLAELERVRAELG